MVTRIITGLIAAAVVLATLSLPHPAPVILVALAWLIAFYELGRAVKAKPIGIILVVLINGAALWIIGKIALWLNFTSHAPNFVNLGVLAALACFFQLIFSALLIRGFLMGKPRVFNLCWHGLIFLSIPLCLASSWAWINPLSIILLLGLAAANDTGAVTAGKLFGRLRISKRVSPNKTLEGIIGGFAAMTAYVFVLHGVLAAYVSKSIYIMGYAWLSQPRFLPLIVLACAALAFIGFFGDITFSAIKRKAGIKDFGAILPGHGGILDRIDALLFIAPWYFLILYLTIFLKAH